MGLNCGLGSVLLGLQVMTAEDRKYPITDHDRFMTQGVDFEAGMLVGTDIVPSEYGINIVVTEAMFLSTLSWQGRLWYHVRRWWRHVWLAVRGREGVR